MFDFEKNTKTINIDNLHEYTAQEVFDASVTHVIMQGQASIGFNKKNGTYSCAYRGDNGLKCAAGVFLTDEQADFYEGKTWTHLANEHYSLSHEDLIQDLQNAHDESPYVKLSSVRDELFVWNFCKAARDVAVNYELSTAAIDIALARV